MYSRLVFIFFFLISGSAKGQIKIKNSNFEDLDNSFNTKSFAWTSEGELQSCDLDSGTVNGGKYSMHLYKKEPGVGRFFQELPFKEKGLRKYKVSVAIKTKDVNDGYAGFSVRVIDSSGNLICHQNLNMSSAKINYTRDWKVYEGDFYTTGATATIKVSGYLWKSGEAWYDDIRIQQIPISSGKLSPKIQAYIKEYFEIVKKKSIVKDQKYLAVLKKNAELLCGDNPDINYCHFILKNITFNLNDGHSFFSSPEEWREMNNGVQSVKSEMVNFSKGKMLENQIAYLNISTFASTDWNLVKQNIDTLHSIISILDSMNPKGWIVDLSANRGGNSFAMFPGIGPLIGNGVCGYSISADGRRKTLKYIEGLAGWDNDLDTLKPNPYHLKNLNLPIAVIYGNETGSSGEVTALTLRGLKNSKSFGQETWGATTRVDNFLMTDSASLNLAAGYDADRNGVIFKGTKIPPDVPCKDRDESLRKAIDWILGKQD